MNPLEQTGHIIVVASACYHDQILKRLDREPVNKFATGESIEMLANSVCDRSFKNAYANHNMELLNERYNGMEIEKLIYMSPPSSLPDISINESNCLVFATEEQLDDVEKIIGKANGIVAHRLSKCNLQRLIRMVDSDEGWITRMVNYIIAADNQCELSMFYNQKNVNDTSCFNLGQI